VDKALLDTDIFSEILKGKNAQVGARAALYRKDFGRYTLSTLSVMEMVSGFHRLRRESRIERLLDQLTSVELLSFDLDSAELAGRIDGDLVRTGQPLGRVDPLIAAIALRHSLTLVTGNQAHYQRIQGLGYPLKLDNWRNPL
jgi:tRNA(fMet)-specific endonuclease VapC